MRMMPFSFDRYTVQSILTLIVYFRFNKRLISIQTSSLNVLFVPETYRLQHITSRSSRSKWFLQSFQLTDVSLQLYFFTSTCGNTPIQTQNLHWHFFSFLSSQLRYGDSLLCQSAPVFLFCLSWELQYVDPYSAACSVESDWSFYRFPNRFFFLKHKGNSWQ